MCLQSNQRSSRSGMQSSSAVDLPIRIAGEIGFEPRKFPHFVLDGCEVKGSSSYPRALCYTMYILASKSGLNITFHLPWVYRRWKEGESQKYGSDLKLLCNDRPKMSEQQMQASVISWVVYNSELGMVRQEVD